MAFHSVLGLDLTDEIQHLLSTAYRERRNDHASSPVEGSLDDLRQGSHVIRSLAVASVSVGGFHDHIVRLMKVGGVLDQRLIAVADITGKYQFPFFVPLCDGDLYTGGSQKMARVHETHRDPLRRFHFLLVRTGNKVAQYAHGVLHGIGGNEFRLALPSGLAVPPLRLKHLDMGAVTKHDITEMTGGFRGVYRSLESFGIDCRQIAGMIHMGMCEKSEIQLSRIHGNLFIFIIIRPLLHTAVHQEFLSCRLQIITAACYFMCCSEKC